MTDFSDFQVGCRLEPPRWQTWGGTGTASAGLSGHDMAMVPVVPLISGEVLVVFFNDILFLWRIPWIFSGDNMTARSGLLFGNEQ